MSSVVFKSYHNRKKPVVYPLQFLLRPKGVLATGSAHARQSARQLVKTVQSFSGYSLHNVQMVCIYMQIV